MMHSHDCQYVHRNSARDRKATKRRMRGLREKRKRPRHNLHQDRIRAKTVGKWTITKHGVFGNEFEGNRIQLRSYLLSRKKIDPDRKRAAIRALAETQELEIERLCIHGAIMTWYSPDGETFMVHIREEDCLSIDDLQWRLNRSAQENESIDLIFSAYEGIHRTQVEQLLDEGQTLYNSDLLGLTSITLKAGIFHNEYLKPESTQLEQSLLHEYVEAA